MPLGNISRDLRLVMPQCIFHIVSIRRGHRSGSLYVYFPSIIFSAREVRTRIDRRGFFSVSLDTRGKKYSASLNNQQRVLDKSSLASGGSEHRNGEKVIRDSVAKISKFR